MLSIFGSKETYSYQHTVQWTMQGLTEPFWSILGCCNFTEAKSHGCVQFYCIRGLFSKKNNAWNKTLHLALEYVQFRSGVSFAALGCSGRQILVQTLTKFDRVCIT